MSFLLLSLVGMYVLSPKYVLFGAGVSGFVGQVMLSWSIYVFKGRQLESAAVTQVTSLPQIDEGSLSVTQLIYRYIETFMLLGLLYFIPHFLLAMASFIFAIFSTRTALTIIVCILIPYFPSWVRCVVMQLQPSVYE